MSAERHSYGLTNDMQLAACGYVLEADDGCNITNQPHHVNCPKCCHILDLMHIDRSGIVRTGTKTLCDISPMPEVEVRRMFR